MQACAGLVATVLVAAATARVTGRLADQLQAAVEYRSLLERAIAFRGDAPMSYISGVD